MLIKKVTDIFVHIIKITDDPNQDELTPEEEEKVEEIMLHPDIRKYLGDDGLNTSILRNKLKKIIFSFRARKRGKSDRSFRTNIRKEEINGRGKWKSDKERRFEW